MTKIIKWLLLALPAVLLVSVAYSYTTAKSTALATLQQEHQLINTSAGMLEYRIVGADKGHRHPSILYIPPSGYDSRPLYSADYQVVIPSRPGYAGVPLSAGESPQDQAKLYAALLDALNIESAIIMTVSAGGPSALAFAQLYPQKTLALVAVAPVSQAFHTPEMPEFLQSDFNYWALFNIIELLGDEMLAKVIFTGTDDYAAVLDNPASVASLHAIPWSMWPLSVRLEGVHNDTEQFGQLSLTPQLITAPVFIIHGTADDRVPLAYSEELVKRVENARLLTIAGADHMLVLSHAKQVKDAIADFLRDNDL